MSRFFIDRPIFAWVIAIFVMLFGVISITQLPITQYPKVAPPSINISAIYPGATAQTLDETVISVIEREMNGADGLMYMEAASEATGMASLKLVFDPARNEDLAQIDVQNRLKRAEPKLPAEVKQLGVRVYKAQSNFLMVVSFTSANPDFGYEDVSDYVSRNILPEIQRTDGVGNAALYASERALRIWLDPAKMQGLNISASDVINAVRSQNAQIIAGSLGSLPATDGQETNAMVLIPGQLTSPEAFGEIILRSDLSGSSVRLKDIARIEMGMENYNFSARQNGQPAVAIGVQLNADGNALATAKLVQEKMQDLQQYFPAGMEWQIPYNTATFIDLSIKKLIHTLLEALLLVILVMFLFLQNIRYTFIPAVVVPVTLLGAFAVMLSIGMTINILALFAMVLVIGIVVDDAIIVVENVERIISEEGLTPHDATVKAMGQISGAIIGITVILTSVFVPLAFFSGATGNIYRQFSLVMIATIAFSAFFALTLTPALCATFLKKKNNTENIANEKKEKRGFFGYFNRGFAKVSSLYSKVVRRLIRLIPVMLLLYALVVAGIAYLLMRLPTGFLPVEDSGTVLVNVILPSDASQERSKEVMRQVEEYMLSQPEVDNISSIFGFSFSGAGQNAALAFVTLKDWSLRKKAGQDAVSFAGKATMHLQSIRDASIFVLSPPAIPALGVSNGFAFRLQDRGNMGYEALIQARNQLLGMAMQSPILTQVYPDGMEDAQQLHIHIDREAAAAQGVSMAAINQTLSTILGSTYVNDFPNKGKMQRVTIQGDTSVRVSTSDIMNLTVPNMRGQPVPLSTIASSEWAIGPTQVIRYNGYPAIKIAGQAKPGYSSGEAMKEMEQLMKKLPPGFGFEWTGKSLDEIKAGSNSLILYSISILAVFLCLAALYESWSIPFAVILVVPLGVIGVVSGIYLRGMPNDIYFQIALITVIGLSAKNAILIVEFAKDLQQRGRSALKAALEAAHLRFRPIIMTSLAFIAGVIPLFRATGASSASQREIGTGVMSGMLTGTLLAIFFVPTLYLIVRSIFPAKETPQTEPVESQEKKA